MNMLELKVKLLTDTAKLPIYATENSAGMDLFSDEETEIQPFEIKAVRTGISVEIPQGYEGQVRPRSGLALKGITVANAPGTIDSDYRGEVKVILINLSRETFKVEKGMRIAQLIISKYEKVQIKEVDKLSETKRGEGGFGSTGLR
ncbi:MAG: dUTP diphosphatase [Candidatus Calescibacterium sp.]|nr:dUTP diphosphatase [Candidatus Calescibacterium sp.]MCX7733188.1 dUTP diphosphatase [bacterium]MDW8086896.1 dUTP diphosphatase [Candidatus Calescibacterium sp.]